MRYYVTVGERTYEVDVVGDKVTVDSIDHTVEMVEVSGTPVRRLSIDGAAHRVVAHKGKARASWDLHLDGVRVIADVVDERTRAIRALTARTSVAHGPKPIRAPMPGMIVRVEVEPGERVSSGQGLVIIEAMKMENELRAEATGVVARVAVGAGTAVDKGAVLIEFASDE